MWLREWNRNRQPFAADDAYLSATRKSSKLRGNSRYNALEEEAAAWPKNSGKMTRSKLLLFDSTKEIEADQNAL